MISVVEVTRGSFVESRHVVHVAVVHADRGLIASSGDARLVSFVRSAAKMFQALPLVEDGVVAAIGLTSEELALCTASHSGEPYHVETARRILAKAGVGEDDMACGPQEPGYAPAADLLKARGVTAGRLHNNCSGKHAGMLALARHHGWSIGDYYLLHHPEQQRILRTLAAWSDADASAIRVGIDGCGLPTFALPLDRVATACARFAAAAATDAPAGAIVRAMTQHPEFVAGTGRLCTALMKTAAGRLFAKVGAEGYYCAGVPSQRLGIALKVEDGALRASEPAVLAVLHALDALSSGELEQLHEFSHRRIVNTRGDAVGEVRARIQPLRWRRSASGAKTDKMPR